MDVVLVTITGIALLLAVAMGLVLFKLLRDERQRSDARVALLAAATAPAAVEPSLTWFDAEPAASQRRLGESIDPRGELFTAAAAADSPWPRRLAIAGGLVALIAMVGYGLTSFTTAAPAASRAALSQSLPLELLALRHTQDADGLTISGLVQNPRTGVPLAQVTAVAFLVGPDGGQLASGRAGLDYSKLAPGDESPFVIKVPVSGTVSRYRVGFRGPDGTVIAHVDRRTDGTAALNERSTGNASWVH